MFFQLFDGLPWVPRIRQVRRCIGCGVCDKACPMGVQVQGEVLSQAKVTDPECIRCMICVDVCPVKSLSYGIRPKCPAQEPALVVQPKESALPVVVDVGLATLAVVGGVWAATRITGFHVFLGASWGLIAGLMAYKAWSRLRQGARRLA
jgi:ferredoxin